MPYHALQNIMCYEGATYTVFIPRYDRYILSWNLIMDTPVPFIANLYIYRSCLTTFISHHPVYNILHQEDLDSDPNTIPIYFPQLPFTNFNYGDIRVAITLKQPTSGKVQLETIQSSPPLPLFLSQSRITNFTWLEPVINIKELCDETAVLIAGKISIGDFITPDIFPTFVLSAIDYICNTKIGKGEPLRILKEYLRYQTLRETVGFNSDIAVAHIGSRVWPGICLRNKLPILTPFPSMFECDSSNNTSVIVWQIRRINCMTDDSRLSDGYIYISKDLNNTYPIIATKLDGGIRMLDV